MSRRLANILNEAKRTGKKLFCGYVTLGFPNLSTTEKAMYALASAGADIIELGFPFSDPLADGPTIQHASERALKNGVHMKHALGLVASLRKKGFQPAVLLFSYLNPVLQFGAKKIASGLRGAGFDGIIVPDLTYEEGKNWETLFHRQGLSLVYLAAPTSTKDRMRRIAVHSDGFVYYVSLRGVTGARDSIAKDLEKNVKALKRVTAKPVLVGFGVSRPDQARRISRFSDGVIVGSALVKLLQRKNGAKRIYSFVSNLIRNMN